MNGFYEAGRDRGHGIEVFESEGIKPHFHAQVEILCVTAGEVSVTINGVTERVSAGGICVSGSYDVHGYIMETDGVGIVLLFPLEYLRKYFVHTKDRVITRHVLYEKSIFTDIMALIALYNNHKDDENKLFEEGWCNTVLGVLFDALGFASSGVGGEVELIRAVFTYIREHYDEDLTLTSISKEFGYNPYHFSRLFNRFTNFRLKQYINSVRLEVALDKLKNGESVTDAAFNSGFNSMRTFYRDFTEFYGSTPQNYVRRQKGVDKKSRDK
ncbi:MAG: AraC family transcriptional regulator [Clostridia bacterium]|nr:AraC family transcriptional regulator [Clostridia bacterium]